MPFQFMWIWLKLLMEMNWNGQDKVHFLILETSNPPTDDGNPKQHDRTMWRAVMVIVCFSYIYLFWFDLSITLIDSIFISLIELLSVIISYSDALIWSGMYCPVNVTVIDTGNYGTLWTFFFFCLTCSSPHLSHLIFFLIFLNASSYLKI